MSSRHRRRHWVVGGVVASTLLASVFAGTSAWADEDDPPLSQAPGPGDTTTMIVPFSVPVSFSTAVTEAAAYPGDVTAIRYDNPELTGEYSFGSGVTPAAFESDFLAQYGTTPAATGLVVTTTVPEDSLVGARSSTPATIPVNSPAFVPPPATFDAKMQSLFEPPSSAEREAVARGSSQLAGVTDWRVSQADIQITNYTPNRVTFIYSYWWLGPNSPHLIPDGFGLEFEVNMYGTYGTGSRPFCYTEDLPVQADLDYKKRQAAQNQNWNWRVIRPDGVTAPSSLGAYADYNDLSDECPRSSIGVGMRYAENIQYVNGAYGILFVIDAPKGFTSTSKIDSVIQAVSDDFCTSILGSMMSLTDCMGVYSGSWPSTGGPKAQTILNSSRDWWAPNKCWLSDFTSSTSGTVYDNTAWACPSI